MKLLSIIDHTRDRALVFLLLRTGIRIGEALSLTMNDIDLRERKVHIYQGEKNDMGRVVYLSNDAVFCLKRRNRPSRGSGDLTDLVASERAVSSQGSCSYGRPLPTQKF
jgi:integrase